MEIIFEHTFLANNGKDREVRFTEQEEAQDYYLNNVLSIASLVTSESERLIFSAYKFANVEAESPDDRFVRIPVERIVVVAPSSTIRRFVRIVRIAEAYYHAQQWRGERTIKGGVRDDGVLINTTDNIFAKDAASLIEKECVLLQYREEDLFTYFEKKLFCPINIP